MTVLNFLPVAKGGGLQNSLSFLTTLDLSADDYFVICRKDSPIEKICLDRGIEFKAVKRRMAFEIFQSRKLFPRGTSCFTIFGPPVLATAGYWNNLCGVAYSNLFYPNIDFWGHLSTGPKAAKKLNDKIRKATIRLADSWIFETKLLADLAIAAGFPRDRVFHVPMAVSNVVQNSSIAGPPLLPPTQRKTILYLGSGHPNKRQHLIPDIAAILEQRMPGQYRFVLTMSAHQDYAQRLMAKVEAMALHDVVVNIGPIAATDVAKAIHESDAMCLLSVLESFSNNYVEAWAMKRLLFVTDSQWSHDSCDDGVVYIEPTEPLGTALKIDRFLSDTALICDVVTAGTATLGRYPSAEEKTQRYLDCIAKARHLGPCPKIDKAKINYKGQ